MPGGHAPFGDWTARFRWAGPWEENAPAVLLWAEAMEGAEERGLASDSLEAFLLEFDHAVRDFEQRGSSRPEAPLQALKTGLQRSLYGSGIDGSGSKSISPSSSLNSSQEDLMDGVASSQVPCSTAKLGDTRELEAFIADLDQVLKEM